MDEPDTGDAHEPAAGPDAQEPRSLGQMFGAATDNRLTFDYAAAGGEFFVLQLVNALLTAVTLGLYYAWARVKLLRFVIGAVKAGEDCLTFHGEGRELFWGVLRAWAMFLVPLIVVYAYLSWPGTETSSKTTALVVFYVLLFVFVTYSLMGSLRYRAARTTWRGIRFRFTGKFSEFGGDYAVRAVLVLVTLGLAYPFAATWRRRYIMEHLYFGGEPFGFEGEAKDLFARYVLCWFLFIPTLGLSMGWYQGYQQAYFWSNTTLAGGRFRSTLTGGDWLGLLLGNAFMVLLTFGIMAPWAYLRMHRDFFRALSLEGADLSRVRAAQSDGSATAEGAADLLDADGALDL